MSRCRVKTLAGRKACRHGLTRRGLLLLALAAAARRANADTTPPAVVATPAQSTDFSAEGLAGIDAVQGAQIVALLEAEGVPRGPLLGKPWPRCKHTYLVAALEAESSDEGQRFHVLAFDLAGKGVRLVASAGPFWIAKDEALMQFDFAAFRLTSKEFAFGLRYSRERSYAGGGFARLEGLFFFRISGEDIEQILRTSMSYEAVLAGEWNEDGTRESDGHAGSAVIIVKNHKTGGYFDWVKKVEGGPATTLIWNGAGYVMNGSDPLESERLEFFDSE